MRNDTIKDKKVILELKRIARGAGGVLKPDEVVKNARPLASPLHKYFTWDDTEAARLCRIAEARDLIRVTVQYITTGDEKREHRVFVSLTTDREQSGGGYRAMAAVLSDAELRTQLLKDALAEMKYFREKYRTLKELAEIFAAMDNVESRAKKVA